MIIRGANKRGSADHGWLRSFHTFSFAGYFDPDHMGFRTLRVINEDRVAPGQGFGTHPHQDMEILSYVLEGAIEHRDSMGTGSVIRPGEVQRMSAGTGVTHSEFNGSKTDPVHFLQIWILPDRRGYEPSYEQKAFALAGHPGSWQLVASRDGRAGSVTVHQDLALYAGRFQEGQKARHALQAGRGAWVQVVRGAIELNGQQLQAGDAAAFPEATAEEAVVEVTGHDGSEVLLFDL